ncbi:MAG: methyltransferase domain-containing protein [Actinomycetota bacterium]|nr:methyltransferase domain-containing protein [Actinomycetota bacterium]
MTPDIAPVVTDWLVKALSVRPGDRVLEVAGGSGTVAFVTAGAAPSVYVICTDVELRAVSSGVRRYRAASRDSFDRVDERSRMAFAAADMHRLPFVRYEFDSVVCRWGFMFASSPVDALAEAARVLRPGGRLAFAVWGPPDENPWQALLDRALEAAGIDRSSQLRAGGMFALADESVVRDVVARAQLCVDVVERVSLVRRYRDFAEYWSTEVAWIESPAILRGGRAIDIAALRRRLEEDLSQYRALSGYEIRGLNLAIAATRPHTAARL